MIGLAWQSLRRGPQNFAVLAAGLLLYGCVGSSLNGLELTAQDVTDGQRPDDMISAEALAYHENGQDPDGTIALALAPSPVPRPGETSASVQAVADAPADGEIANPIADGAAQPTATAKTATTIDQADLLGAPTEPVKTSAASGADNGWTTETPGFLSALINRFSARPPRAVQPATEQPPEIAAAQPASQTEAESDLVAAKAEPAAKFDVEPMRVASVGGVARLAPRGIDLQHADVEAACLDPRLLALIRQAGSHFDAKPIISSGYRSPKHNRRAGGAKNSLHTYCKAADFQLSGISKWDLAKYLRLMPGRGGVGTYCRTESIHLDIGSKRDWHYPCRRKKSRKKRKT